MTEPHLWTDAVAYLLANLFPAANFLVLLSLLVGWQRIHAELEQRTRRFENIERLLGKVSRRLDSEVSRNNAIEHTAAIAKARADVAEQRADTSQERADVAEQRAAASEQPRG